MACRGFLVDGLFHQYGINNINIEQIVDMIKSNIATNIRWIWLMSDDGIEMKYTGEDDWRTGFWAHPMTPTYFGDKHKADE